MKTKVIIGLTLLFIGLFWGQIQERIPDFTIPSRPSLDIMEPSEEIKEKVSSISSEVVDDMDRLNLAVFNNVFSERVLSYSDAKAQQINDIYTDSAKIFFGQRLKGKYSNLADNLTGLMSETLGSEDHVVTPAELQGLSSNFQGLSWSFSK
jgi:hypothetical protein